MVARLDQVAAVTCYNAKLKKDLSKLNLRLEEAIVSACEQSGCNHFPAIDYFDDLKQKKVDSITKYSGQFQAYLYSMCFFINHQ